MANDEFWTPSEDKLFNKKNDGIGALRISMLFACGAIALALVVTPMVAGDLSNKMAFESGYYDNLTTSSIGSGRAVSEYKSTQPFPKSRNIKDSGSKVYTIRRSITQTSNETCIIFKNGLKTNGCN